MNEIIKNIIHNINKTLKKNTNIDIIRQMKVKRKEIRIMSNVKWTKEQLQAIEEKDSNILVAAAARKWKDSCFSRAHYS